jgi:hypothetical protein
MLVFRSKVIARDPDATLTARQDQCGIRHPVKIA